MTRKKKKVIKKTSRPRRSNLEVPKDLDRKVIKLLRDFKLSAKELASRTGASHGSVKRVLDCLQDQHYAITSDGKGVSRKFYLQGGNDQDNRIVLSKAHTDLRNYRLGVGSDVHVGSISHLGHGWRRWCDSLAEEGITEVFLCGDMVDGYKVYPGHLNNLREWSVEGQTDLAAEGMRPYEGVLEFRSISGNHDYSYTKASGVKPLDMIAAKCDNFKNDGDFKADWIIGGAKFRGIHGAGGRAYSFSYSAEVYLRNVIDGSSDLSEIPDSVWIGHYHKSGWFQKAGVHVLYPGNFQGQNEYLVRKGLSGPHGGFIVDMDIQNGDIKKFLPIWVGVD